VAAVHCLSAEAKADQILVTSRVAGLLEGLVDLEEVGRLTLKGFSGPSPPSTPWD
jgi:class 3 adenylate cyclase